MPLKPWTIRSAPIPPIVQRVFRGSSRQDPFTIADEFSPDIVNMTTAKYPVLSTRPGYSVLGAALGGRVLGLGVWQQAELNAVAGGIWYKFDGTSWVAVSGGSSLNLIANWSYTNFKGTFGAVRLLAANGADSVKVYDGSTVSNITDAPNGGKYIETFAERVWCVVGNDLHGCALGNATNWSTFNGDDADPYIKTIETKDGEMINAIKAGNNHLTIFKPNSIHELFGFVPSAFNTIPVTFDIGAASDQAIASVEGTFYFVHKSGFYQYAGSTLPDKGFSQPIQEYIDRINPAQMSKVNVGTDGKFVYIALPLDNAAEPDTIIEYNVQAGTFAVWKNFAPLNIATLDGNVYIGGVEGQVRKLGGTTDNGAQIHYEVISKPYGAASLAQRLMWKRAWVTGNVPSGSSMTVGLSKSSSGNDFTDVQSIPAATVIQGNRVVIPTNVVAFANWIRYKLSGQGPVDIIEFAREEETLPIV